MKNLKFFLLPAFGLGLKPASLEKHERKFRSQRSVEPLVGDEEYIVCYSCLWAQNIDTEEIYIDEGNCNSDSADSMKSERFPKYVDPSESNGLETRAKNICQEFNETITETIQTANETFTVNVHVIERAIFQVYEDSSLWEYEGNVKLREEEYACGVLVSTCSEAFTSNPERKESAIASPCSDCFFIQADLNGTEDVTVLGNSSCRNAASSQDAVCEGSDANSIEPIMNPGYYEDFIDHIDYMDYMESVTDARCLVEYVEMSIDKTRVQSVLWRKCLSDYDFPKDALLTTSGNYDMWLCQTDLCNFSSAAPIGFAFALIFMFFL